MNHKQANTRKYLLHSDDSATYEFILAMERFLYAEPNSDDILKPLCLLYAVFKVTCRKEIEEGVDEKVIELAKVRFRKEIGEYLKL